jgi:hypothetical protein
MMNVVLSPASLLKGLECKSATILHSKLSTSQSKEDTSAQTKASIAEAEKNSDAIRAECKTLVGFIRKAWCHIPELADKLYVHGWHIDMIALHLEAITSGMLLEMGKQNRLLCNVPPSSMKSLLVSVFWPAWEWTQDPSLQYIATSYRADFCNRDTSRMRDLVSSEWYKMLWGKDRNSPDGTKVRGIKAVLVGDEVGCRMAQNAL